ncbi:MAG TPA: glycosyltransferase family 39 protein [Pyrinomonadaceae bacterium]|nr:glycosyltransferase family 39 protein [Pyrinomonadaceae bacterium]
MEDALKQKRKVSLAIGETIVNGFAAVRRSVVARKAEVVCGTLLLVMAANLLVSISRKSITNDEIVHIPAGYYHLVAGDFQLNNEHPPLVKMWAALPLLLVQPEEPAPPTSEAENFMQRTWGFHERFWQANETRFQAVTFWPRAMMVPITLALGLLIFVFTRRLFGDTAAMIAVGMYTLEPTVLAHGRIVHTDVPSALVYLLFFFALRRYHEAPGLKRAVTLGIVCALALLTKFSMLIIVPVLGVYLLGRLFINWRAARRRSGVLVHGGLMAFLILLLVNAAYYFKHPVLEASDVRWVQLKSPAIFAFVTTTVRVLSKIIPTYYLFGVYNIELHNHYGHATSLLGQYNDLGWWYYFPVAFALKTTIPFLLIAVVALAWTAWRLAKRDSRFVWIAVPVAVYLAISLTSHINIGVRHFLPVFPFLFIAGGALLAKLLRAQRAVGIAVLFVVFGFMGFEAARTFPDYTPYMNQLASAHPHWYYLSDSNVEWGDDVNALAAYLKVRNETRVSAALAGGWSTLSRYGVDYVDMVAIPPDQTPETRYVAIGAAFLNGSIIPGDENVVGRRSFERTNLFARYRNRKPEAVFGNSIYLFREHE